MKILLAYKCHDLGRLEFYSRFTPLGLGYIGALLRRRGYDARIANMSEWSWRRVAAFLEAEKPDLVGVSAFTFNRHEAMRVAALARRSNPRCLIIAGGPHATHLPHHLLRHHPQIDAVVRGEGEETVCEIAAALQRGDFAARRRGIAGLTFRADGRFIDTRDRPVIADLDRLPHPADDPAMIGVDPASQFEFVITSRGCPAACTFCSSPEFWGRGLRFRSAGNMIEEVRLLRDRLGVVYVSVRDDTFTANRARVLDFCRGLVESGIDLLWDCQSRVNIVDEERLVWMRRAGCTHIQYGVESGSPRILQRLNKGIDLEQVREAARLTRRVGLGLSIYLITGVHSENDEDLASTLRLIDEIRPHDGLVSPLAVYPGTGLYAEAQRRFGLGDDYWLNSREAAFYVRDDPWTRKSLRRIGAALSRVGKAAAYGPADFAAQQRLVGTCHALRLAVGEYHAARGRLGPAEGEYRSLLEENPRSLWARMRLGALAARRQRHALAADHYRAAIDIVPAFHLAHTLLGEALLGQRRREAAREAFSRALSLCPTDPVARRHTMRLSRAAPAVLHPA